MIAETLDRTSHIHLYHQLKLILRNKVENGEWKPGDQIPTEEELCERYRVSRITVKQAVNGLVADGLLYRQQGRGTFVATPKIEQEPERLTSFSEQMQQRGLRPGGILLSREIIPASKKIAEQLKVQLAAPIIQIQRLRLADNEPMGIQTAHIPLSRCPQLLEEELGQHSLYKLFAKYGIHPVSAMERYEAVLTDEDEAKLLNVAPKSPAFLVERVTYDEDGLPVEFVKSVMRGDRYIVTVALRTDTA